MDLSLLKLTGISSCSLLEDLCTQPSLRIGSCAAPQPYRAWPWQLLTKGPMLLPYALRIEGQDLVGGWWGQFCKACSMDTELCFMSSS